MNDFYATVAQASFTLLGLWWVLLQIRYREWGTDARLRGRVYDISVYFLLTGMMSLFSLLGGESTTVWRVGFAVAGVVGVAESLFCLTRVGAPDRRGRLFQVGDWISIPLYAGIALVAIWRTLPSELGIELPPLNVEGILVALLLFVGISLGAAMFVSTESLSKNAPAP